MAVRKADPGRASAGRAASPLPAWTAPLAALAAGGPAPVFAAVGAGARDRVEALHLDPRLRLVASPRHASVLLVAGRVPEVHRLALRRVHDQLPHPRATLGWGAAEEAVTGSRSDTSVFESLVVRWDDDPAAAARALHRRLLSGEHPSEPHRLPDEPPAPWRGLGDHGQGGEGMMGGRPYGRPMAMTGDDLRDGLALDRLPFTVGPFLPGLPPGLVLRMVLQGDVVQEVEMLSPPYPQPLPAPFRRARHEPVTVAEVECARARALLRSVARGLHLLGAGSLARRALGWAREAHGNGTFPETRGGDDGNDRPSGCETPLRQQIRELVRIRRLLRYGVLASVPRGIGTLGGEAAARLGGPCARAAGHAVDGRTGHRAYRHLGFEPWTGQGDGACERFVQRLDEAEQALRLAEAAEAHAAGARSAPLRLDPAARIEGPEGERMDDGRLEGLGDLLAEVLPGLEWSRALLVIASLEPVPTREVDGEGRGPEDGGEDDGGDEDGDGDGARDEAEDEDEDGDGGNGARGGEEGDDGEANDGAESDGHEAAGGRGSRSGGSGADGGRPHNGGEPAGGRRRRGGASR